MLLLIAILTVIPPSLRADQPTAAAVAGFDRYVASIELQHAAAGTISDPAIRLRLLQGGTLIENLSPPGAANLPGALLHHWRGSAFVAGARADEFDRLLRNFSAYPAVFSPQVLESRVLGQRDNDFRAQMRIRQRHVLTVVLDTTYDVEFARRDPVRVSSFSRSVGIDEIASAGTSGERPLPPPEDHGFLWRLDTWWTCQQADGGVYLQIESVSLTRSIPAGLGWVIGPYVESVPRDSLAFTLRAVCNALRR